MSLSYRRLQQYAIGISVISIIYNNAEGAISVGLGSQSSSRSLVFFGVQSAIEVISAGIVVWRFNRVALPGEEKNVILGARELRYVTVDEGSMQMFELAFSESRNMHLPPLVCYSLVFLWQLRSPLSLLYLYTKNQILPMPPLLSPLPPSS